MDLSCASKHTRAEEDRIACLKGHKKVGNIVVELRLRRKGKEALRGGSSKNLLAVAFSKRPRSRPGPEAGAASPNHSIQHIDIFYP